MTVTKHPIVPAVVVFRLLKQVVGSFLCGNLITELQS